MNLTDLHRIRDAIAEGLEVRRGCIITDEIVRDRSNNICEYLRPIIEDLITAALRDAARGEVVVGSIGFTGETARRLEDVTTCRCCDAICADGLCVLCSDAGCEPNGTRPRHERTGQ